MVGKGLQVLWYSGRMLGCSLCLISVPSRFFDNIHVSETRQQLLRQSLRGLRFKSNRVGHAVPQRNAIMGALRGQIQHVARVEHPSFFCLELAQYFQGDVISQREVFLLADAPAALSMHLQQKNIVAVKVRPHATFVGRITDHDVIEPSVGNETELIPQLCNFVVV